MKTCQYCGHRDGDVDWVNCPKCGRGAAAGDAQAGAGKSRALRPGSRPSGLIPMILSGVALAASLFFFVLSFNEAADAPARRLPAVLSQPGLANLLHVLNLRIIAGSLLALSVILWSVGYIARALSFLPGRDD